MLYGTIGILAAGAALGTGGRATDTHGAMSTVLEAPLGRGLLIVIALGLLGYATWRVVEAIADPEQRGTSAKGLALRAGFFIRGLVHAGLAYSAIRLATGQSSDGGGGASTKRATGRALEASGGDWLVLLVAIVVVGYGVYQLYRAATTKLGDKLDTEKASAESGRWVIGASRFGIAARGVVFMAMGWLLARAATHRDPSEAGGVGEALRTLEKALGRWPFAAIAVGMVAYAGYEVLNARYRRFTTAS